MQHNYLSVSQAAQLKGVSRASVYSAIARNRLPHKRILGHVAVREADVQAWTPLGPTGGKPTGTVTSEETKARISQAQKRRWEQRKQNSVKQ